MWYIVGVDKREINRSSDGRGKIGSAWLKEMDTKKPHTLSGLKKLVIGKKLRDVANVNFDTCYPVVARKNYTLESKIIDVVCAESDSVTDYGETWATDGSVAIFTKKIDSNGDSVSWRRAKKIEGEKR